MNATKLLLPQQFRMYLKRYISTPNKNIDNVVKKRNENASFNKNSLIYNYINKSKSNKHYLSLPDALNFWLKIPQDKLQAIKAILDYVLQAVILLDDVQDGTQFRRNLPSAHRIYGVPWTVNSSLFCLIAGLKNTVDLNNPAALDVFCEEIMSTLDGIALDLYWRDAFVCPTEDEYKAMSSKKTASLYLLQYGLMQVFSQDRRDYRELLVTLGLYYQIRDEYTNLVKLEGVDTKSQEEDFKNLKSLMFCEDITEGQFTWTMIHGLNSSEGPTIRSILVQRTTDVRIIKQHCLSLLKKVGSLDYTRQTLQHLDADLRDQKNSLIYNYINKSKSNKHYLSLPDALNFWLKIPQDKLQAIKAILDYVLQAVILLDDVQDGTQFRRNLPSAHRIYGVPWTVNSSLFCLIAGLKNTVDLNNPAALDVFCEEIMSTLDGIALDLYWRDAFVCPTEDEYKAMSSKKTASLYLLQYGLMQVFSQDRRDYRELLVTLGLYYQIRDEYTNLVKLEGVDTKSQEEDFKNLKSLMFCEDITEGQFTWTMIHGLNSSEGPTIRSILVQRTTDVRIKQHCLSLLKKVGSLDYTRQTLQHLDADLRDQIHHLGGNQVFLAYLDELYNWK